MPDAPQRFWTTSKLVCVFVGIPVIAWAVLGYLWYASSAKVEAELASLRADGLPTNLDELAEFYVVPADVANSTGTWVQVIDEFIAMDAGLVKEMESLPFVGEGPMPIPLPDDEWTQLGAARTFLAKYERELELARREAGSGGQARYPVDFSLGFEVPMPYAQNSRVVAKLLWLDAHVCLHDGNHSRTFDDLRAIFAVSDSIRGEPLLISQLVRMANHAIGCYAVGAFLPQCKWNDAELESLQSMVCSPQFKVESARALYGERALCLAELDRMTLGPLRATNKLVAIRYFQLWLQGLESSWGGAINQIDTAQARLDAIAGNKLLRAKLHGAFAVLPLVDYFILAGARAQARQRCLNAALAVQRHRLMHGQLPGSPSEIDPQLLGPATQMADALIDPFDGQPLRYQVQESQVIIYSVGSNGVDDGGDLQKGKNGDLIDIGFTVKK